MGRHLIKPRGMKLSSIISRRRDLNAYLSRFSPDAEGQEPAPLPADELVDIIYCSEPVTWKIR